MRQLESFPPKLPSKKDEALTKISVALFNENCERDLTSTEMYIWYTAQSALGNLDKKA